jgi:hypothetical protein
VRRLACAGATAVGERGFRRYYERIRLSKSGREDRRQGAVSPPVQPESRFLRTEPVQQQGEGAVSHGKWRIGGEESGEIAVSSGARLANTYAPVDMTGRVPGRGAGLVPLRGLPAMG